MRIGLISDTHIPSAGRDRRPQVYEAQIFAADLPAGKQVNADWRR